MAVPWLRILDALIGVTDIARSRRIRPVSVNQQLEAASHAPGGLEARLAGVVVAALKEAFDRDTRRLELECQQLEAERLRAEQAMRVELVRQAGDREIGRLRLAAGIGVASWLATLLFATRIVAGGVGARLALGSGWLLLLAGTAASFVAQSQVALALQRASEHPGQPGIVSSGLPGALVPWLVVAGLAVVGMAVLIA